MIVGRKEEVLLAVKIGRMGCSLTMRNFDMTVDAHLGELLIEQPQYASLVPGRKTLFLIDNVHQTDENLVDIKYISVSFQSFDLVKKRFLCISSPLKVTVLCI